MPRKTAKSKSKHGNSAVKTCGSKNTKQKNAVEKEKCIKQELVVDSPKETVVEEVFHRKSERRRVARDIFLVFEEESNSRRTRSSKKQTKPKFGHLKVEDPIRPKGLLRDIKNEPKCYLNGSNLNSTLPHDIPILTRNSKSVKVKKEVKKIKNEKSNSSISKTENSKAPKTSGNIKSSKTLALEKTSTCDNESKLVARVNPIFLWVKQDDTRIVEVRCEDYDKRNRIRITKTPNGWRAIPRSDPTTSRVLKFCPTPLMKVKRESTNHETNNLFNSRNLNKESMFCKGFSLPKILPECVSNEVGKLNGIDTVCNPLATKNSKSKNKKTKKMKKSCRENYVKESKINDTAENKTFVNNEFLTSHLSPLLNASSLESTEHLVKRSAKLETVKNKEQNSEISLCTKNLVENIPVHVLNKNQEDLKTNIIPSSLSLAHIITSETKSTYQKESEKEHTFHLCPKTGLFLPNVMSVAEYENESFENINENNSKAVKNCFLGSSNCEISVSIEKDVLESKIQLSEENTESLEAKTRNLKDLLDDADLLQNCDDNANSDADLIDTLVKTSCENNLIQANEIIIKATMDQMHHKTLEGTNEMGVQLIPDVSEPPKCLSFNEAGEIEGLNEELFQSNAFMETFDKQSSGILVPQVDLHSTTSVSETLVPPHKTSLCENIESVIGNIEENTNTIQPINEIDESPKDLSYKKREEVCPQSESRSQCAVTSSSDVIKSPQHVDAASLASPSETLKNLILEQFMKLNALSTQHQREPTDDIAKSAKSAQSGKFIETVVIEDDDENYSDNEHEQPLKKRLRLSKHKVLHNMGKLVNIDKDPDPLTQLRLLIRNTQWKVPDPILVPKDRLSAVLASPAREIPLLITTRPELRLPEAFAYPEIIQNPNILVISMAQLEAILKNELEVEKTTSLKSMKTDVNQHLPVGQIDDQLTNRNNDLQSTSPRQHHQHASKQEENMLTDYSTIQPTSNITTEHIDITESLSEEYTKIAQTEPSSSDLNSATMTVLNQMLWLPYFGHISQDISQSIKNAKPLSAKSSNSASFLQSQFNGLTNIEDICKSAANKKLEKSVSNTGWQSFQQQFKTNEELSLFQKIVQHQMQSVLQLNQVKADTSKIMSVNPDKTGYLVDKTKSKIASLSNLVEQRKQKDYTNKQTNTSVFKNQMNNCNSNITVPEKSYNLRSSVAGRHSIESKQYSNYNQRKISDNKPRLTCKSLSNLLDPEHSMVPSSSSSVPYVQNLSTDFLKNDNEIKRNYTENKVNESNVEQKVHFLANATVVPQSQRTCGNISIGPSNERNKQKPKTLEQNLLVNDAPGLTSDTNVPLWHPLFGSNTKTAYSSPWQWTTVTATGE